MYDKAITLDAKNKTLFYNKGKSIFFIPNKEIPYIA